jgi:hypothetical protein
MISEMPMDIMVKDSKYIIEGEVLNSEAKWNKDKTALYTLHTIKVYKDYKNLNESKIILITRGGQIGQDMLVSEPSLKLNRNQYGIFFINECNEKFQGVKVDVYESAYNAQSFYKYDFNADKIKGLFQEYSLSKNELYHTITRQLKFKPKEYFMYHPNIERINKSIVSRMVTSFTPSITTAGTFSTITITGMGFGSTKGRVFFTNADYGPNNYSRVYQHEIVSWTNTQIVVEVPPFAGTGLFLVRTSGNVDYFSPTTITVRYSVAALPPGGDSVQRQTRLASLTNVGDFIFTPNTSFNSNTAAVDAFLRAFKNWYCNTNVYWKYSTSTTTISSASPDGVSVITFASTGTNVLGITDSWYSSCSPVQQWYCKEIDMRFSNTTNWNYSTNPPLASQSDFESVALHELGHATQLGHVIDETKVMHRNIANGTARRVLSIDEIDGGNNVTLRSQMQGNCSNTNFKPMKFPPNIVVSNTNSSGAGSLAQAVIDVCENDTISFSIGANSTIIVNPEISISKNLKIIGLSQSTFNLSGNNLNRMFNVQSGTTLTLQSLRLINGTSTTNGGAFLNNGTIQLKNVSFINNSQNGIKKAFSSLVGSQIQAESSVIINQ